MESKIIKTQIRFPRYLRDWLKKQAKDSNRSMNGEIVELMKQAKEVQEKEIIT